MAPDFDGEITSWDAAKSGRIATLGYSPQEPPNKPMSTVLDTVSKNHKRLCQLCALCQKILACEQLAIPNEQFTTFALEG